MTRRRWHALLPFLLLAGICAVLAQAVQQRLDAPPPEARLEIAPASGMAAAPANGAAGSAASAAAASGPSRPVFDPPPRAAFEVVMARNLFAMDRTPPPEPGADTNTQELKLRPLRAKLIGVVLAGPDGIAIVQSTTKGSVQRLAPGDTFEGWELAEVGPRSASFRQGKRTAELSLAFGPSPGAGTATGDAEATGGRQTQSAQRPGSGRGLDRGSQDDYPEPVED